MTQTIIDTRIDTKYRSVSRYIYTTRYNVSAVSPPLRTFRGLHAAALAVRWAGKSLGVRGKDEKTSWEHEFHATARHHDSGDTSDLAAIIVYIPLSLRSTRSM